MSHYLFVPGRCPNRWHLFNHRCGLCGYQRRSEAEREATDVVADAPDSASDDAIGA